VVALDSKDSCEKVNAEAFNNSLVNIHVSAVDYLKQLGYNHKAIEECLKNGNQIYKVYKDKVDKIIA